jgi:hypothetical protein
MDCTHVITPVKCYQMRCVTKQRHITELSTMLARGVERGIERVVKMVVNVQGLDTLCMITGYLGIMTLFQCHRAAEYQRLAQSRKKQDRQGVP